MESPLVYKPHLRADPIFSSRWPTQHEYNGNLKYFICVMLLYFWFFFVLVVVVVGGGWGFGEQLHLLKTEFNSKPDHHCSAQILISQVGVTCAGATLT